MARSLAPRQSTRIPVEVDDALQRQAGQVLPAGESMSRHVEVRPGMRDEIDAPHLERRAGRVGRWTPRGSGTSRWTAAGCPDASSSRRRSRDSGRRCRARDQQPWRLPSSRRPGGDDNRNVRNTSPPDQERKRVTSSARSPGAVRGRCVPGLAALRSRPPWIAAARASIPLRISGGLSPPTRKFVGIRMAATRPGSNAYSDWRSAARSGRRKLDSYAVTERCSGPAVAVAQQESGQFEREVIAWWAALDSNQRPLACQASPLERCATSVGGRANTRHVYGQ